MRHGESPPPEKKGGRSLAGDRPLNEVVHRTTTTTTLVLTKPARFGNPRGDRLERRLAYLQREHIRLRGGPISFWSLTRAAQAYGRWKRTLAPAHRWNAWQAIRAASQLLAQLEGGPN
jgi:hypothetical protein